MAEELGTASLGLEADPSQLERDLNAVKAKAASTGKGAGAAFSSNVKSAALPAAVALGAVVVGAHKVIGSASDLNEAVSAADTTFGKAATSVQKWSQNQEDAFSRVDYLSAAKTFAVFGQAADLNGDALTGFSKHLVDAAGDLASFHNVDPTQVLDDLRSGLTGETEPLRKYGILLNEASLNEFAWSNGIAKRGKDLTEQQKIMARQGFILQHLGAAEGDYKRTADSAANTERRQAANQEDLQAGIGKGLLPVYQSLQSVLLKVTTLMGEHTTAVTVVAGVIAGLAVAVLATNAAIKVYEVWTKLATAATWLWNIALRANPIVLIITLLVALGIALVVLWKKSETFRTIVIGVWDAVRGAVVAFVDFFTTTLPNAFRSVLNWLRAHWPIIATIISGPFAPLVLLATDAFGIRSKLIGAMSALLGAAKDKAKAIGSGIKDGIVNAVSGLGSALAGIIRGAINGWVTILRGFGFSFGGFDPPGPGSIPGFDFHPFAGLPYLDRGGIMPGPLGVHRLAWVAGGETVLPTHRGAPGRGATIAILEGDRETISWLRSISAGWSSDNGGRSPW